jgi:hypothetical protein
MGGRVDTRPMEAIAILPVSPVLDGALSAVLAAAPEAWPEPTREQAAALTGLSDAYSSGRPADVVAAAHALEASIAGWAGTGGAPAAAQARLAYAIHRRR